ncbi:hypothetical protein GCM10010909_03540 [Acidocella aquatica]|uniref:Uncharacterized protein n=1 Tax=Acidocella aquatica TaxID=1922313 RepID=A0ABQ5ZZN5_9PROT|nr:SDR family oxidoreductase [Acidocella aquatica]GLR65676.1 hypothetical protein GCM10010909_03540 [Acidocella aquatica]
MEYIAVIGASGEVGRGITSVLLTHGFKVAAIGQNASRLATLAAELGDPANLRTITGSLKTDATAQILLESLRDTFPRIDGVVVSVNGPRATADVLSHSSNDFAALIAQDLVTHFTAARCFIPAIAPGGVYLAIGGGSADFILEGGVHLSAAQAGLRMLYRGIAHELDGQPITLKELTIASVVNSVSTRADAHPLWVTETEIGEQVAAMLTDPAAFPGTIWRMTRRDNTGHPGLSGEGPTRVQGFKQGPAIL